MAIATGTDIATGSATTGKRGIRAIVTMAATTVVTISARSGDGARSRKPTDTERQDLDMKTLLKTLTAAAVAAAVLVPAIAEAHPHRVCHFEHHHHHKVCRWVR